MDNATDNDVLISNAAIDYSNTLKEQLKLEIGALWNRQELSNFRSFFEKGNALPLEERFENTQSTYAAYALLKYQMKKVSLQAGLRGERFSRQVHQPSQSWVT